MVVLTLAGFSLFAYLAIPFEDFMGAGILFSRGAALAIELLTASAMILICYDLLRCCRGITKNRCKGLLDHHLYYHRWAGYLILIYSLIHTVGHLTGSVRSISEEKNVS